MLSCKRILHPTDFSDCARQAFDRALVFAKETGAELHVLHAVVLHASVPLSPAFHFEDSEALQEHLGKLATDEMANLTEDAAKDIRIHLVQERGVAAGPVILDYAESNAIDLIVLGTHGRRGARRLLLGSVAEEVMRLAQCPVVTLREQPESQAQKKLRSILTAVDFSENSRSALKIAAELARLNGAHLHVAHVLESRHHPDFGIPVTEETISKAAKVEGLAEVRLRQFAAESIDAKAPHTFHVELGRAASVVSSLASEIEADFIVVGSQGFSPLEDLAFGSTAEGIIRQAECPVLTVKPDAAMNPDR